MPRSIPSHLAKRFGRLVKRIRTARGLTQEGPAERADLSRNTITRMEFGTFSPSLETLAKLVAGLDSSLGTLFTALDGNDAVAREIIAMAHRASGVELALAVCAVASRRNAADRPWWRRRRAWRLGVG